MLQNPENSGTYILGHEESAGAPLSRAAKAERNLRALIAARAEKFVDRPAGEEEETLDCDSSVLDLLTFCLERPLNPLAPSTEDSYFYYAARLSVFDLGPAGRVEDDEDDEDDEGEGAADDDDGGRGPVRPLGKVRVRDLTGADVKRMHKAVGEREGHPTTANRMLAFLKACCTRAEIIPVTKRAKGDPRGPTKFSTLRRAESNPCKSIKPYPEKENTHHIPQEGRLLFVDECNKALANREISRSAWGLLMLMFCTGLRRFDAFNLRWEEVFLSARGGPHLMIMARGPKKTRSKGGKRRIALGPFAVELLSQMPRVCEFVFPNPRTLKPYHNIGKQAALVYERAGVPFTGFHGLRHTVATALMEAGTPLMWIREQMGWSTVQCVDRYTHGGKKTGLMTACRLEAQLFAGRNDAGMGVADSRVAPHPPPTPSPAPTFDASEHTQYWPVRRRPNPAHADA